MAAMQKLSNLLVVGCLLVGSVVCSMAAAPTPAVEKAIAAAEKEWAAATMAGDRPALEKILGEDLSYSHSSAKHETKAQFIEAATGGALKYEAIEFKEPHTTQYGNTAIVTHDMTIRTAQTGSSNLYVTHVWAKQNGRWQLVSRQATKLP